MQFGRNHNNEEGSACLKIRSHSLQHKSQTIEPLFFRKRHLFIQEKKCESSVETTLGNISDAK